MRRSLNKQVRQLEKRFAKLAALRAEKTPEARKELGKMNNSFIKPMKKSVPFTRGQLADVPMFQHHL